MRRLICFLVLGIFLLSSCSEQKAEPVEYTYRQIVLFEGNTPSMKTYTIEEDNENAWLFRSTERRKEISTYYSEQWEADYEEEREIEEKTKNWRRVIDGELIVGYDDEEDELFYKYNNIVME